MVVPRGINSGRQSLLLLYPRCHLVHTASSTPEPSATMSKEQETPEISEASPDFSHYPVVAAGSGKTAANEGAQSKTVYNVRLNALVFRGSA